MAKYIYFEGQELSHLWWDGEAVMYTEVILGKRRDSRERPVLLAKP